MTDTRTLPTTATAQTQGLTVEPRSPRSARFGVSRSLFARAEPMLWLTGGTLVLCLAMIIGLLALVLYKGMETFWPQAVVQVTTHDGRVLMGEVVEEEHYEPTLTSLASITDPKVRGRIENELNARNGQTERRLLRTGNFDLSGTHFNWVSDIMMAGQTTPKWALVVERQSWGRFYGFPAGIVLEGDTQDTVPAEAWRFYRQHHETVRKRWYEIKHLETDDIGKVNHRLEEARLDMQAAEIAHGNDTEAYQAAQQRYEQIEQWANKQFQEIATHIKELRTENDRYKLILKTAQDQTKTLPLDEIVRAYPANQLNFGEKLGVYLSRWWEFLSDEPREANSEGGVFPAIFGTVLMTLIMCIVVVPFGVLAALYLREYAKAGPIVSAVRIAVNNLAGVPSIVFGVFGLGFLCYGIGSYVDAGPASAWSPGLWLTGLVGLVIVISGALVVAAVLTPRLPHGSRAQTMATRAGVVLWITAVAILGVLLAKTPFFDGFFQANLPNPTFGKGALIWASLTLALMTLPVVIVATEEALSAVPNSMREGSYACGASKWQTIKRIVLPRAMPGIMTGTILAMARGAGEVAPLMLVGAVKLAPELPFALEPPFGVNRSFMHLGFHIYDLGFQSQNSEAAKPMVFTTTLLLILIIAVLNLASIWLRSRLQRKFSSKQL